MRWVEWGESQNRRLDDARWMLASMITLLGVQARGGVKLAQEGYLLGEPFGRGITMAAHVDEVRPGGVLGAKWVSSRPQNLKEGRPRGEAVTILNAGDTGLPVLVFDGTRLSNARTAIFAIAALDTEGLEMNQPLGLLGAGRVHEFQAKYARQLWPGLEILIYDPDMERAKALAALVQGVVVKTAEEVLQRAEAVSVATSGAPAGWITRDQVRGHVFINTSLRDVGVEFFANARVVVDEQVLAAQGQTPYHQWCERTMDHAETQRWGIPLCNLIAGKDSWRSDELRKPLVVNPMGCAAWDVGLGYMLWAETFEAEVAPPGVITLADGERLLPFGGGR